MNNSYMMIAMLVLASQSALAQNVESRAYFATNPDGGYGKASTVTIDGNFSDWSEDMIVARNGANNIATAYKGSHENNVLDIYALYASWDDANLYLGWQMCNTGDVWARDGDGPLTDYGKIGNVPLIVALSVDPSKPGMTGLLEDGRCIWCDQAGNGTTFDPTSVHVDHMLFMSAQPGQGEPSIFTAVNAKGDTNYGNGCTSFSTAGITYNKADGFQPSSLWRCRSTAEWYTPTQLKSDPSVLNDIYDLDKYDNLLAGPVEGLKPHDTAYDTFFEIKIPLRALGITRDWLEANGIGARVIATRGESALDCCPFDPSMVDSTFEEYGKDNSTTHEKDDLDVITYAMADVAKKRDLQNIEPTPTPDPTPEPEPTPGPEGEYKVYFSGLYSNPHVYLWDKGNGDLQLAGAWPGKPMTRVAGENMVLWSYTFTPEVEPVDLMVIFNNGGQPQTADLKYVNNGIFNESGFTGAYYTPITAVEEVEAAASVATQYYDLQGRKLNSRPDSGMYILVQGSKVGKVVVK